MKSWFLPNTFHVFLAHSPTLSTAFQFIYPVYAFAMASKPTFYSLPTWTEEMILPRNPPSLHQHTGTVGTSNFVDWPATGLSDSLLKDRQCWNTHIWFKLINLLLIYIISMKLFPLENLTSTESCPSSYIDNTAMYLLCLSLSFPILPVLSHLLPYSNFPKKIYKTLF